MNLRMILISFTLSGLLVSTGAAQRDFLPPEKPDDSYHPMSPDTRGRTPAYRVVSPGFFFTQVNVDSNGQNVVGDAANEPSIAVNPNDATKVVIGWRQFDTISNNFRQAGNGYTTDGGMTWNYHDVIQRGIFRSDPVLDSDSEGNVYYNSLTTQGPDFICQVFKSTNGGMTWDGGTQAHGGDKQWMTIDKTGGIGDNNVYAFWTLFYSSCPPGFFTRSGNGGVSYESCIEIPGSPYWGTLSVGPDGELYIAGTDGFQDFLVAKSSNAQDPGQAVTWDQDITVELGGSIGGGGFNDPNPGGLLGQTWVATDHSAGPTRGNVYLLCSVEPFLGTDPQDVMFSRSTDGGVTWSAPVRVNDDAAGEWQWFGTMSVAPNGRIDAVWLDTRDNPGTVLSSLYYSSSIDGGATWSPNERISDAFDPHVGWPNQQKMGDYYHMVSDNEGAHLAWAATFNGEQDVYYARIYAEEFIPAAPALALPADGATLQPVELTLVWEPSQGASGYRVQLDTDMNFTSPVLDDSTLTGVSADVSGLSTGTTYYWRARASSSAGWGEWSGAWSFATGDNPPAAPSLVSPPDMATGVPTTTMFEWSDTASGATWGLQVATDNSFLDPVVDESGLTATTFEVSGLEGEMLHYWRVHTMTTGGTSVWSDAWSFTTSTAIPAAPSLFGPPDGFVSPSATILFRWNASPGATSYHFQVATDDQFTGLVTDDPAVTVTTRIVSNLMDGEEYYWRVAAANDGGTSPWSDVWTVSVLLTGVDEGEELPTEFSLRQNYPNPFNPTTKISFDVPEKSAVSVEVFDILGKQVAVLASREYDAGRYTLTFDAAGLGGGVYFYRMTAGSFIQTRKLLLVK